MKKRYLSLWFPHLLADNFANKQKSLKDVPFALVANERNKQIIIALSYAAKKEGLNSGMPLADAHIFVPSLQAFPYVKQEQEKLLQAIAEWLIRYTPHVAIDWPDGIILEISGCTHLWGGEALYLTAIRDRLKKAGYHITVAIADTIAAAWAISRYSKSQIVKEEAQMQSILALPPAALRLEEELVQRLTKLGFYTIDSFIRIAPATLRRRFGDALNIRIGKVLGYRHEAFTPIAEPHPYTERLPCLTPINTAKAIEIAIENLLTTLCVRLQKDDLGIRSAQLKCYRLDGKLQQIGIGTHQPSIHIPHLFKLFELKIKQIKPDLGIELFVLEATAVETLAKQQEALWVGKEQNNFSEVGELLDRISIKAGKNAIRRYFPQERHWPEHSIKAINDLEKTPEIAWFTAKPRPTTLLHHPAPIKVSAPIPDYPPMTFIYQGKIHRIVKADGPERIEREWWLESGAHRDYYYVEDENGKRYWLFRLGHYDTQLNDKWFIHGFFA